MILLAILSNLQFERLDERFPNFKGNFISANAPPSGHRGYDNCLIFYRWEMCALGFQTIIPVFKCY